jgi:3-hydroxy acid dehydrogenase / malonic semialdehyde reductase
MKTILITGATAGIGEASAIQLAKEGHNLIITGRREGRLEQLKYQLISEYNIQCMALDFDVRDKNEVNNAMEKLPTEWRKIDVLINNAGLAVGLDPIDKGLTEDWDTMVDTNIKGLLYVTKAVIPHMIARKQGQIINIGSIAGKEVYANGNVYCATKHALDALTKGMRIDLLKHNIRVSSICPGPVETEFSIVRFKGDAERAKKVYEGYEHMVAGDIAEAIVFTINRPPHVNINDMLIMATAQANSYYLNKN